MPLYYEFYQDGKVIPLEAGRKALEEIAKKRGGRIDIDSLILHLAWEAGIEPRGLKKKLRNQAINKIRKDFVNRGYDMKAWR